MALPFRTWLPSHTESVSGGPERPSSGEVNVSSYYWSSSTNANNTNNAWGVNFNNGNDNTNNKSNNNYVRAVRGGKESLLSFKSVHDAYMDCRKRKRGTMNAVRFEYDLIGNLTDLALSLQKGAYRPSRSVCFIATSPKLREVFAADFRDRVVHHLIVGELQKTWEPCFIHDSYACREGKGTHKAVKRLQSFMLKVSKNRKRRAWFLQLDIRSFFMSIDKQILFEILKKKTDDPVLLDLIERVLFHDPVKDYVFKGDRRNLAKVPAHKSLFKIPPGKGLPIGNLTSQFFANVYLNELDQFVKHNLRCRFYLRYVDDFILLSDSAEQLEGWKQSIEDFIQERLLIELKSGVVIKPVAEGADFLGYIVRPDYILVRNRVAGNLKYKLALLRDKIVSFERIKDEKIMKMTIDPDIVNEVRQTLASYLGHFQHANAYRMTEKLFKNNPWLLQMFFVNNGKILDRLKYRGKVRSLRSQVSFFRYRFPESILFFQVGKFVEVYNEDALYLNMKTGVKLQSKARGMTHAAGFPSHLKNPYMRFALLDRRKTVYIREEGMGEYVKRRFAGEIAVVV